MNTIRYLTVALTKGRLTNKAMEVFEAIGISYDEMKDKASGGLIFVNEDPGVRFFLAKVNDVSTYVEYGVVDTDIVRRDTILEKGHKLYEVMNPGVGKCRVCTCGPESARERLKHHELTRVTTKYLNIAKDCSHNQGYQTVGIVKLNSSIEPAPVVGLFEMIVDIAKTGSTPRENEFMILEEMCGLSARMVVNQMSMKTENERIAAIAKKFQSYLKKNAGK